MSSDLSRIAAACVEAGRGRRLWRTVRKRHSFAEEDLLLLLPATAPAVETAAVEYLPAYLRRKKIRRVVAVAVSEDVAAQLGAATADLPAGAVCLVEQRSARDVAALCRYYRFVQFTPHIVVLSTEEPFAEPGLLQAENFGAKQMVETYLMGW